MSFFAELKRRNVFRVTIAYVLIAWVLLQAADFFLDVISAPNWVIQALLGLAVLGLPAFMIFSWVFELTPEGIKRENEIDRDRSITQHTARKLDRTIIVFLALVVVWFAFDEFYLERELAPTRGPAESIAAQSPAEAAGDEPTSGTVDGDRVSIAVLPFRAMSSGQDDEYFADGLTEEILNSLAGLPELLVTARTSSFHFKGQDLPVPEIAERLGVEHVVEGSVRRSGNRIRVTAQLIRASDGFHLWSQNYDKTLEDTFAVQEDIATNIAATLDVVLNDEKLERMRRAGIGDVEAFIAYQKGLEAFSAAHRNLADDTGLLLEANAWFDQALERVPDIVDALYLSSDHFGHILFDHAMNLNPVEPETLDASVAAIRDRLSRAIRAADNEALRSILQIEMDMFGDDWSNLPGYLETAFETGHCNPVNWMEAVALPYGWAPPLVDLTMEMVQCDPISSQNYVQATTALVWDGRAEEAQAMIDDLVARVGYEPWIDDQKYMLAQATGTWKSKPDMFAPTPSDSNYLVPRTIFAYSVAGRVEEARAEFEAFAANNPVDDYNLILVAAAMGDRELANAAAAAVDQRIGGNLVLSMVTEQCYCGAPFDLEATPNFRARLEEAGLPWPPPSPITFPAKTW